MSNNLGKSGIQNNQNQDSPKKQIKDSHYSATLDAAFEDNIEPPDNGPWYCSFCNWMGSFYERFDTPFINFFILQNFNHGLWVSAILALKDYYKDYLHLDPGESQLYITIVYIPWSFKILYGLISDNVPLFGSKRKSWLIIMGALQFLALFSLAVTEPKEPLAVAFILALASLSEAFVNVVSDAMMVVQSRKDPAFGSQDLITLMYISTGFGGAIGCIYGGLMTQYSSPKWCWFYYSFFGVVEVIFALFLTKNSEEEAAPDVLGESDISTSLEDYESKQRKLLLETGNSLKEAY